MLRNCINCGKVHTQPTKMCEECREKEKKLYKKVKNYLWNHPNSTIDKIHDETEVSRDKIIKYVKEGRFEITDGTIEIDSEKE